MINKNITYDIPLTTKVRAKIEPSRSRPELFITFECENQDYIQCGPVNFSDIKDFCNSLIELCNEMEGEPNE